MTSSRPRRPSRVVARGTVVLAACFVALCLLCTAGMTITVVDQLAAPNPSTVAMGCGSSGTVDPNGSFPQVSGLTVEQVRNAAIIVRIGQDLRVPPRGWVIGVATALQESWLTNLPYRGVRNDHDSVGLFQQRPSQGWGTPAQLADPGYQAHKFFDKLMRMPNWQLLPLTVVAQRIQISAYPNAYAKHETLAARVVDAITGGASRAAGAELELRCAAGTEVTASGWTVPLRGPVTSGFRTASRPSHNGVDIAAAKGTTVRAATAGVVLVATCNANVGGLSYSCDRDGGTWVSGCGWYVDMLHAGGVITRYCHMMVRPYVTVGQNLTAGEVIGLSGSSGNSSGPHLHFEVHRNNDAGPRGAVDPVPFMNQMGASLTGSAAA